VIPFDIANREKQVKDLEQRMAQPDFWNDPDKAQALSRKLKALKHPLDEYRKLKSKVEDAEVLLDLGEEEGDSSTLQEVEGMIAGLDRETENLELKTLLKGKYDGHNAIVALHAGAGGTESQDWVSMLLRMYTRWAEAEGYEVKTLDFIEGEEAGLKSVTILVSGDYAYGFLKAEKGVHRLVRISPFDASGRRHTSFASVDVLPEIDDEVEIEIRPEDLRIDTFRSAGAGGQHVNKTDSAVRITHLPTGIVVSCQNERSQHANRDTAMKILRSRLLELKEKEREEEINALRGEQREIAWGSQIRSYVFAPYRLVKDHRTGREVGDVQAVMDGEISGFIYSYLQQEAKKEAVQ